MPAIQYEPLDEEFRGILERVAEGLFPLAKWIQQEQCKPSEHRCPLPTAILPGSVRRNGSKTVARPSARSYRQQDVYRYARREPAYPAIVENADYTFPHTHQGITDKVEKHFSSSRGLGRAVENVAKAPYRAAKTAYRASKNALIFRGFRGGPPN